jgi:hypothetical protein
MSRPTLTAPQSMFVSSAVPFLIYGLVLLIWRLYR